MSEFIDFLLDIPDLLYGIAIGVGSLIYGYHLLMKDETNKEKKQITSSQTKTQRPTIDSKKAAIDDAKSKVKVAQLNEKIATAAVQAEKMEAQLQKLKSLDWSKRKLHVNEIDALEYRLQTKSELMDAMIDLKNTIR